MQELLEKQLRSDISSIEQSQYNEHFHQQIQALLEYGMYAYAYDRIILYQKELNMQQYIQLTTIFQQFKQHQQAIKILILAGVFDKQLDLSIQDQKILFKLYYIGSLISIEGVDKTLKETKNIFNAEVRKEIQDYLKMIQQSEQQQQLIQCQPKPQIFQQTLQKNDDRQQLEQQQNDLQTKPQQKYEINNLQQFIKKKNIFLFLLVVAVIVLSGIAITKRWVHLIIQILWKFIKKTLNL